MTLSRRSFLKNSTAASAAAAALSLGGPFVKKANAATGLAWPDTGTMEINPAIDNLRVVVCNDPTMIQTTTTAPGTLQWYNDTVNTDKVQTSMDKMAIALAQKSDAASAWATIFRKPANKTWSQVKAAIKVNCIDSKDQPRLAIVDKICKVLNALGVPFANISLYDCSRSTSAYSSTYAKTKLPAGIVVTGNMGTPVSFTLPKGKTMLFAGYLNDGSIDILVNIAVNKGHDQFDKGKTTLCLKNHYGTFWPNDRDNPSQGRFTYPKPNGCGNQDYLSDINKSTAILGGTPVRQQLCIIDSIWAMEGGPTGGTIVQNNRIVMGTFAGAVDYLTARKIRQDVMKIPVGTANSGLTMNDPALNRFLTDFGYDLNAANVKNLDFVDALTYTPSAVGGLSNHRNSGASVEISVSNRALKSTGLHFELPQGSSALNLTILDMTGRAVRKLPVNTSSGSSVVWDGKTGAGKTVSPGTYIVKLKGVGFEQSGRINISR